MKITRGKIPCAKKVVVYGPEGIGKSTFASRFPDPVFIETEGSTKDMDVARLPAPTSWEMIMEEVGYVIANPDTCKTLIVDTADWAEQMCSTAVCSRSKKSGIEDFGYGKGYVFLQEEFGRLLNLLTELVEQKNINVVLNAHAKMRKFEQPDEMGAYDRWEMKLTKQVAPIVKEWADMVLFANYKTHVINVDGKHKAQGGQRVMYTTHHSCWDAKNRYGLPEEVPFEYSKIAHIISSASGVIQMPTQPAGDTQSSKTAPVPEAPASKQEAKPQEKTAVSNSVSDGPQMTLPVNQPAKTGPDERIPKALRDLMQANGVDDWDIQNVVAARGYFPSDVEVWDYPSDFIDGVLIGAWPQVLAMIKEMKEKEEIPFN